jgi:hypothetical protein
VVIVGGGECGASAAMSLGEVRVIVA